MRVHFDGRQAAFAARSSSLAKRTGRSELAKVKSRVGKVRVDQSIDHYNLAQLQRQAQASGEASVEMQFESETSHFE